MDADKSFVEACWTGYPGAPGLRASGYPGAPGLPATGYWLLATGTDDLIRNWLRNRNTIEFLGIWEHLNNPGFKPVEFDGFRKLAGLNSFTLTPKQWIEKTGAIGIIPKAGRYGGTYAHKDIAFEFVFFLAAWKLLLEVVLVP
jgi:hypothetical protein